jgi:FkbM family methyltransferase
MSGTGVLRFRLFLAGIILFPAKVLVAVGLAPFSVRFIAHLAYLLAGGEALRYNFELGPRGLVMDLGGYRGHFALEILKMHECRIWVFEAIPEFAARLSRRLGRIPGVKIFAYGLAGIEQKVTLAMAEDATGIYEQGAQRHVRVRLRAAAEFLAKARPKSVDLMKINVEGAEYELLERLVETPWIGRIQRLQVQFHPFVPGALGRMKALHARLGRTHRLEWCFPMVWESWVLKGSADAHR